jgi:chromosome segregation ATPase
VEVDILNDDETLLTIRRILNSKSNASSWMVNGKHATQKSVKDHMIRLSIDVDNLCAFMPQDRVGEFTCFGPVEVLQNTLKSIVTKKGDSAQTLFEEQKSLADIEALKRTVAQDKYLKEQRVSFLRNEIQAMDIEIERLNRRKQAIEILDCCRIKLIKVEGDGLRTQESSVSALLEEKTAAFKTENDKIGPLQASERRLRAKMNQREKASEDALRMQAELQRGLAVRVDEVSALQQEVEEATLLLLGYDESRSKSEAQLAGYRQSMIALEQELAELETGVPLVKKNMASNSAAKASVDENISQIDEELQTARSTKAIAVGEIGKFTRQLNDIQDTRQVFRARLTKLAQSARSDAESTRFNDVLRSM